jgi:hypothetical protein
LDRSCGFTTREISAAIERLLQIDVLIIENEQEIFNAVSVLKTGKARFADVVIAELGRRAGLDVNVRSYGCAPCRLRTGLIPAVPFCMKTQRIHKALLRAKRSGDIACTFLFWFASKKNPAKNFANSFAENSRLL